MNSKTNNDIPNVELKTVSQEKSRSRKSHHHHHHHHRRHHNVYLSTKMAITKQVKRGNGKQDKTD